MIELFRGKKGGIDFIMFNIVSFLKFKLLVFIFGVFFVRVVFVVV